MTSAAPRARTDVPKLGGMPRFGTRGPHRHRDGHGASPSARVAWPADARGPRRGPTPTRSAAGGRHLRGRRLAGVDVHGRAAELRGIQLGVGAPALEELLVRTLLDDAAVAHHEDD